MFKSLRVRESDQMRLERAAIEISFKTGKQVRWTDVTKFMFENMVDEAKRDMIASSKK